jgi:DNA-binding NarL/FixJ family response regulator
VPDHHRELRDADSDWRIASERRLHAIKRAKAGGLTDQEIADELGVTRSAVSQALRRRGVRSGSNGLGGTD